MFLIHLGQIMGNAEGLAISEELNLELGADGLPLISDHCDV
jgi:hypothetical protein